MIIKNTRVSIDWKRIFKIGETHTLMNCLNDKLI